MLCLHKKQAHVLLCCKGYYFLTVHFLIRSQHDPHKASSKKSRRVSPIYMCLLLQIKGKKGGMVLE